MATVTVDKPSLSVAWRKKGNDVYKTVTEGLAPSIAADRLQTALTHYARALTLAQNRLEKSSAAKNIAMTHWRLAKTGVDTGTMQVTRSYHFRLSLEHFSLAWQEGSAQNVDWLNSLVAANLGCWTDLRQRVDEWAYEKRIRELEKLVMHLLNQTTQAREYLEIATHYFHWSLEALNKRDFRVCLRRLGDCHFPLEEAKRLAGSEADIIAEVNILQEDIYIQTCVAQSIQARQKDEELLVHILQDEEELNFDAVWDVIDAFKESVLLTRERDVELEAMSYSALGRVFHKVLKLKDYSKRYLSRALRLAAALMPKNSHGQEWFEFAQKTVQCYQDEILMAEEAEKCRQHDAVMEEIKEDVDKLEKEFRRGWKLDFLKFVYKEYPPRHKKDVAEKRMKDLEMPDDLAQEEFKGGLKNLYRKAITHYHPDGVNEEEHGKAWKVLSGEIMKRLSRHYANQKGFPE